MTVQQHGNQSPQIDRYPQTTQDFFKNCWAKILQVSAALQPNNSIF
jgi:hypothetical protein